MLRDCGKGCVYSVIVSFGVIVSLSFPISIVKGIFGVYATGYFLELHNDYQNFGAAEALSLQNGEHFISQVLTTNR